MAGALPAEDLQCGIGLGEYAEEVGACGDLVAGPPAGAQRFTLAATGVGDDPVDTAEFRVELGEYGVDGLAVSDVRAPRSPR